MTDDEAEKAKILRERLARYETLIQERNRFASHQRFLAPDRELKVAGTVEFRSVNDGPILAFKFGEVMEALGFTVTSLQAKLFEAAAEAAAAKDREAKAV